MSKQETFDRVVGFLVKQGKKSYNPESAPASPTCMYRSPTGMKCAVGVLIPDKKYKPEIEGKYVGAKEVLELVPQRHARNRSLLIDLQDAHDKCPRVAFVRGFKSRAKKVAKEHNLAWKFD